LLREFGEPQHELVIARLVIDYISELHFPGNVEIGTRIVRIGSKSFTLQHGVFMAGENTCAAVAECVMVFFNAGKRESMVPPPRVRSELERIMEEQPPLAH